MEQVGILWNNSENLVTLKRSICVKQAADEAEEDEGAEEVAMSTFFKPISLSASPHLMEFLGNIFQL